MVKAHELIRRANAEARPCLRLIATDTPTNTHIGGIPALPADAAWPSFEDEPLAFLAQIDLAEAQAAEWPAWMPKSGKLLFFYDAEQRAWGFDPADAGRWRVLHVGADEPTSDIAPPHTLPDYAHFARKHVGFEAAVSYPSYERVGGFAEKLDRAEYAEAEAFFDSVEAPPGPRHQLLGWPYPVQSDEMELECQLASNGVYVGDASYAKNPNTKALETGAKDWDLLLQLDTDGDMMWGDCGTLYFWVRREDAQRCDFSNVWMVLQCC